MMLPARTACPPNFFTPRRLLSLSRPLRDEPPAFLCAMTDYFAFELFLAAPLAGAAFSVEAAFAVLPPAALFLPLAFFSGPCSTSPFTGGLAFVSSCGAGLGVALVLTFGASEASAFLPLAGAAGVASALG